MLIVGAKGFAKEVLEVLFQCKLLENVAFYDNVSKDLPSMLYRKFPILNGRDELDRYQKKYKINEFTLGVGNPQVRLKLAKKIEGYGLNLVSTISPFAVIGHYDVIINPGVNCMSGVIITNSVSIGRGCLINLNCTIGHDSFIGQFVEMSPGVHVSGNCKIEDFVTIGTNATILPNVQIGANSIIGAGAVVTKDIPKNSLAVGIPAKVIKKL